MKKYTPEDLYDFILSTQEITCYKCDTTDEICEGDDVEASIYFFNEGWRCRRTIIYCPKCVKKY